MTKFAVPYNVPTAHAVTPVNLAMAGQAFCVYSAQHPAKNEEDWLKYTVMRQAMLTVDSAKKGKAAMDLLIFDYLFSLCIWNSVHYLAKAS